MTRQAHHFHRPDDSRQHRIFPRRVLGMSAAGWGGVGSGNRSPITPGHVGTGTAHVYDFYDCDDGDDYHDWDDSYAYSRYMITTTLR